MLSGKPKAVFDSLSNTLEVLQRSELIYIYNAIKIDNTLNTTRLSWPNHLPGYAKPINFNRIEFYKHMLDSGSFTCILFDSSIIRISYTFTYEKLESYNFLWWPSPFAKNLHAIDIEDEETFDDSLLDGMWHEKISMRSPIRFDFDKNNESEFHPMSHLHTQESECRIKIAHPICFNRFFQFIFQNFYFEEYIKHDFWNDFELINFYTYSTEIQETQQATLGWIPTSQYITL